MVMIAAARQGGCNFLDGISKESLEPKTVL